MKAVAYKTTGPIDARMPLQSCSLMKSRARPEAHTSLDKIDG